MKPEISKSVDQRRQSVRSFQSRYRGRLQQSGSIAAGYRHRGGRQMGPYFRLTCRDATGRQRSVYLGPAGPLVEQVRRELAELQNEQRSRRALGKLQMVFRAELTAARRQMDPHLAELGLRRKGAEIRGWRRLHVGIGMCPSTAKNE